MKTIFFLFFLLFFSFSKISQAQDAQEVDSLLALYNDIESPDTLKIKILGKLYNAYLYNEIKKSKEYLTKSFELSEKINYEKGIADYYLRRGCIFEIEGQLDSASVYYSEAQGKYQKLGDKAGLEATTYNLGAITYYQGNFQQAIDILQNHIQELKKVQEMELDIAKSMDMLSRIYGEKGFYKIALENSLSALRIYENHKNQIGQADALNNLATIEDALGHSQKSIDYNLQAGKIYKSLNDDRYYAISLQDLGATFIGIKDYYNAKKYLEQSIEVAQKIDAKIIEAVAISNLGTISREQGNFEESISQIEKGLKFFESNNDPIQIVNRLNELGKSYLSFNKNEKALSILNQAIVIADTIQSNTSLKKGYLYRSKVYERLNRFQPSLNDFKKYHALSDSILNKTKIQQIEELRIIHDLEQKEKEITIFSKNAEIDKVKSTRLWISLLAAIGIGSILLWTQWLRRRKEKEIENQKQKVAALENQKLNYELDFKKQELTSKVLQLCRRNEFLQSLEKEVKEFKSETEGNERHRLEKLSRKINRDMDAATDWEQFLKSFETVHPDFNKLLLQKYPNFAPNEIRMACLMRMNLESKDIANLLNVTPDSVKKARYRMRKKMEKDSAVNLTEYFLNFGNS